MSNYSVSNRLFSSAVEKRVPINGSFEITAECNFNCRMCYVHNCARRSLAQNTQGADKWLPLFDQCEKHGLLYALVTGGEPLLHREFEEIYSSLINRHILTDLNTNGYLIDGERLKFFRRYPPSRINLSLYGTSDEIYHRLCGVSDGFTRTDRALRSLKDNGFNVSVNLTLTKTNYPDMENIVRYAKENGFHLRPTTYVFGAESNCVAERLPAETAATAAVELYRLTHDENSYKAYLADSFRRLLAGEKGVKKDAGRSGISCRAGTASYWVHSDGRLNFCGMVADSDAPNAFEVPFAAAWETAVKKAAEIAYPAVCENCGKRFFCRRCHAMTDSEGIKQTEIESSYACIFYKAMAEEITRRVREYGKIQNDG